MNIERYHTVIQRHHIWRRQIQAVVATLVLTVILGAGFLLGRGAAYNGMGVDPEKYRALKGAVPLQAERIQELERELAIREARNTVDRQTLELVRKEIAGQREQILELEESLRFYQSLISPEGIARGLVFRSVEMVSTEEAGKFAFRIVAQQEASKHDVLQAKLTVRVLGRADGEDQAYLLSAISEDVQSEAIELRFRYFQVIEGVLLLPSGFLPGVVDLVAKESTPDKVEVREQFPWSVQKRFNYVGK